MGRPSAGAARNSSSRADTEGAVMRAVAHARWAGRRGVAEVALAGDGAARAPQRLRQARRPATSFPCRASRWRRTDSCRDRWRTRYRSRSLISTTSPNVGAPNRTGRAPDQTNRILTVVAGPGDQQVFVAIAFTHEPGSATVSLGACAHAIVATRAHVEIHHQDAVAFHQPLVERELDELGRTGIVQTPPRLLDPRHRLTPELLLAGRRRTKHLQQIAPSAILTSSPYPTDDTVKRARSCPSTRSSTSPTLMPFDR